MSIEEPSEIERIQTEEITGKKLLTMSVISFVIYAVVAWLIYWLVIDDHLLTAFDHGLPVLDQIGAGVVAGMVAAGIIMFLSGREQLESVLDDFTIYRAVSEINFSPFDRIQISLFAGVGEELLFRGAIQPLLGIWITSVLFIGIHGYFKFKSSGHIFFGLMMFGLSVMLGFLFEIAGLVAAMTAHAVYDVVMLWWVNNRRKIPEP
jgi:uncharacterized protein